MLKARAAVANRTLAQRCDPTLAFTDEVVLIWAEEAKQWALRNGDGAAVRPSTVGPESAAKISPSLIDAAEVDVTVKLLDKSRTVVVRLSLSLRSSLLVRRASFEPSTG